MPPKDRDRNATLAPAADVPGTELPENRAPTVEGDESAMKKLIKEDKPEAKHTYEMLGPPGRVVCTQHEVPTYKRLGFTFVDEKMGERFRKRQLATVTTQRPSTIVSTTKSPPMMSEPIKVPEV